MVLFHLQESQIVVQNKWKQKEFQTIQLGLIM